MTSVNLIVVVESVRSLISKEDDELKIFHIPSIIAVAAALSKAFAFNIAWYSSRVRVSSWYFLSYVILSEKTAAKSPFFGKTIAMTYVSIHLVCLRSY